MSALSQFLEPMESLQMQLINKRMYDLLSQTVYTVSVPSVTVVLERKRTEFYLCRVLPTDSSQRYWKLFEIGDEKRANRVYSPETLGFSECYFQFFVAMSEREFYAFPLFEEAYLREGFKLTFDNQWQLVESKKIAPPPEDLMRPTILQVARPSGGKNLLMVGGDKERHSIMYDTVLDTWTWLPKLPIGHNITCNVSVNWLDKAVFTFLVDGALNIKCAVLKLQGLE